MSDDTPISSKLATCASVVSTVSRETRRAETAARLGVIGDFARIPQLAKALGIAANSIYAQIRIGTFPIAHRRVGSVVVVKLDDYIEWFYSEPEPLRVPSRPTADATPRALAEPSLRVKTGDDRVARIKQEASEARERLRRRSHCD